MLVRCGALQVLAHDRGVQPPAQPRLVARPRLAARLELVFLFSPEGGELAMGARRGIGVWTLDVGVTLRALYGSMV